MAIHGYRQSDKAFNAKLGSLRKSFKKEVDFVFIKAPHKVTPTKESDCDKEEANECTEDADRNSNLIFDLRNHLKIYGGFDSHSIILYFYRIWLVV